MYCKNCGKDLEGGTKFCPNCGTQLEGDNNSTNAQQKIVKKKLSPGTIALIVIAVLIVIGMTTTINTIPTTSTNSIGTSSTIKYEKTYINPNEVVTGKNWEITIQDAYFGQTIDPPEKSGFYTHYQVSDTDNTYLCVILNAKNISNLELRADKVATVKAKYDNSYSYSSFSTIPDSLTGFTYTNITNIKPLTSDNIYYLIEMPKSAEDATDKPIEIEIKLENNTYYYQYR